MQTCRVGCALIVLVGTDNSLTDLRKNVPRARVDYQGPMVCEAINRLFTFHIFYLMEKDLCDV